jgi:hypothetical protein
MPLSRSCSQRALPSGGEHGSSTNSRLVVVYACDPVTAQKPLRSLAAVVDLASRVHAVGDRVGRLGPEGFVAALDVLARDAARGTTVADCGAMLACALWLASAAGRDHIDALSAAVGAVAKGGEGGEGGVHPVASAMLDDGPAHKRLSRHGRLADTGGPNRVERYRKHWAPSESAAWGYLHELTLRSHPADEHYLPAERRLFHVPSVLPAWGPDYDGAEALGLPESRNQTEGPGEWVHVPLRRHEIAQQVDRLGRRPDPAVLRVLLRDRSVRERDVVSIAARRPSTPAIVAELLAHLGWMARPSVRIALLENPFTPTRIALLLLPTCSSRLRSLANANVHPRVRTLAALLSRAP